MYTNVIADKFSTSPLACHPDGANREARNAWDKGGSRFCAKEALLQMYHIAIPAATPRADSSGVQNAVSDHIFEVAL